MESISKTPVDAATAQVILTDALGPGGIVLVGQGSRVTVDAVVPTAARLEPGTTA